MTTTTSTDFDRFRDGFFEECAERIADLEDRLSRHAAGAPLDIDAVFRAVHSIKAGAGAFGFGDLVRFAHAFEATLDRLRSDRLGLDPSIAGLLVRASDELGERIAASRAGRVDQADGPSAVETRLSAIAHGHDLPSPGSRDGGRPVRRWVIRFAPGPNLLRNANDPLLLIRDLARLGPLAVTCDTARIPPLESLDPEGAYLAWTVHLATEQLPADIEAVFEFVVDDCDLTIEPEPEPDAAGPTRPPSPAAASAPLRPQLATSIRVDVDRIDRLVDLIGELAIAQGALAEDIAGAGLARRTLARHDEVLALTRALQDAVMAIRMQPVRSVFARIPRLVRDLAHRLGKEVRLEMTGEATEVDKTVVEELADPLMHMVRNAVDHGIEPPGRRKAAGKPAVGTIRLSARRVGGSIHITLEDDGAGIDRTAVLNRAVERALVPAGTILSDEAIDDLVFAPGFSTATTVTDVSGRGVGMDVVRRSIAGIGGRVSVANRPGLGATFILAIPLTLALLDGMVVTVGGERYVIPLAGIVESVRPRPGSITRLPGGSEMVTIRADHVRLLRAGALFGVPTPTSEPTRGIVVVVETAGGVRYGLAVDDLVGQQTVVVKGLAANHGPVPGLSGATILGDGRVALIVDIEQLGPIADRLRTSPLAVAS
jgi:two-component system chemotaxis sensor kinase CheA